MSESSSFLPTHAALMPLPEASDALPVGTQLGEFTIREVIGVGGFGIVYRAWEPALEREVALKEFMPMGLVTRAPEGRLALRARSHEEDFLLGLRSFVNEARLLARFDNLALVKVHRFWEMNGTAYMAMPFYKAQTLRQRRQDMGLQVPTQAWLLSMIEPLLGALSEMHRANVYHRDIAPDNILWCDDNRPVLLDFGAARQVLTDRTQSLTAILKPQFAPIEQYADSRSMRQGPWTDIFALASTCYFMLTGRPPVPATARILSDELMPLAQLAPAGFSTQVLATLDWAMCVRPEDRPQAVATFWDALHGHLKVPVRAAPRLSAPARHVDAADSFEHTIQTSASASPLHRPARSSAFDSLRATVFAAVLRPLHRDRAGGHARRPGIRPTWLLLAIAGLSAGASAWLAPWHPGQRPDGGSEVAAAVVAPAALAASDVSSPSIESVTHAVAASPTSDDVASNGRGQPRMDGAAQARGEALRADIAWAAAHEASAPAAGARRTSAGRSAAARHESAREACHVGASAEANACVKRLCRTESRFRHDPACTASDKPAHWWLFGKSS